jgi:hypothetical protein
MPTGNNNDSFRKKPRSLGDCCVSAADRNLSKVRPGAKMATMAAVLNFSNAVAGGAIGLMQQMGLLGVEPTATTREMVTWFEFNIHSQFAWALHPMYVPDFWVEGLHRRTNNALTHSEL